MALIVISEFRIPRKIRKLQCLDPLHGETLEESMAASVPEAAPSSEVAAKESASSHAVSAQESPSVPDKLPTPADVPSSYGAESPVSFMSAEIIARKDRVRPVLPCMWRFHKEQPEIKQPAQKINIKTFVF